MKAIQALLLITIVINVTSFLLLLFFDQEVDPKIEYVKVQEILCERNGIEKEFKVVTLSTMSDMDKEILYRHTCTMISNDEKMWSE